MPSDTASTQTANPEPLIGVSLHNTMLLSRVCKNQDCHVYDVNGRDSSVCTIRPFFTPFVGNPLAEFQLEFPKYQTSRLDYGRLNDAIAAICKLRYAIDKCPEYLAVMKVFGDRIMGNLPQLELAFDNHYLQVKPYALNYFGWPNLPCVLALGYGSTTRNTRQFVNQHLHRIGALASQWLYVSGYLATHSTP